MLKISNEDLKKLGRKEEYEQSFGQSKNVLHKHINIKGVEKAYKQKRVVLD